MGVASWAVRKLLIRAQRKDGLVVDPDLLDGKAPQWAVSMFRLAVTLLVLPFLVWLLLRLLPESRIIDIGKALVFNSMMWRTVPATWVVHCTPVCHDLLFGMVIIPVTWLAGVVGAFCWYALASKRHDYDLSVVSRQPAPTQAEPFSDKLAGSFRRRPYRLVMMFVSIAVLSWVLPGFAGELHYSLDKPPRVFTTWRFGLLCSIYGLSLASLGAFAFMVRRSWRR
jgi:hypothetical protein